jgi:hypothetical protein
VLTGVKYQEDVGAVIVSDGKVRRDNFHPFMMEEP